MSRLYIRLSAGLTVGVCFGCKSEGETRSPPVDASAFTELMDANFGDRGGSLLDSRLPTDGPPGRDGRVEDPQDFLAPNDALAFDAVTPDGGSSTALARAYRPLAQRICTEVQRCDHMDGWIGFDIETCCMGGAYRSLDDCVEDVLSFLALIDSQCREFNDLDCVCSHQRFCIEWMSTETCDPSEGSSITWPRVCGPDLPEQGENCCVPSPGVLYMCDPNRPPVGPIDGFFPPPLPADAGPPP